MNKNGNLDIVKCGEKTQFKRGHPAPVEAQKKSAKRQRENQTMRETMRLLSRTTLAPGKAFDLAKLKNLGELSENKNLTLLDAIALKIAQGAMDDDPECRRLFLELSGAMDKEKDAGGNGVVTVIIDV